MLSLLLAAAVGTMQPPEEDPLLTAEDIGLAAPQPAPVNPKLVRRGQSVALVVRAGTLTITAQARALADGREGDPVRVVTPSSRTIEGIVEASGAVRVASTN